MIGRTLVEGGRTLGEAAARFLADECPLRATGLAYVTLLGLVPLTAVAFGVLAAFPVFERLLGRANDFVFAHLVPETGAVVQGVLETLTANAGRLGLLGALMLVATALLLMAAVDDTLNRIWGVRGRGRLWRRLPVWWTVLTLGPVLVGAALAMVSYGIRWLPGGQGDAVPERLALEGVAFLLEAGACLLLYAVVPRGHVPLGHAVAGALAAALLLELARRGFGAFVARADTYRTLYGSLAALPVLLVWIQVSWMVVLYGAELCRVLGLRADLAPPGPALAVRVLRLLREALPDGAPTGASLARRLGMGAAGVEACLDRLAGAGIVRRRGDGGWVLVRPLAEVPVRALLEACGRDAGTVAGGAADPALARLGVVLAEAEAARARRLDAPVESLYVSAPEREEE